MATIKENSWVKIISVYLLIILALEIFFRIIGLYDGFSLYDPVTGKYLSRYDSKYASCYQVPTGPDETNRHITSEFKIMYRANNLGFRDNSDYLLQKKHIRIITIGDSFTEGVGASNDSLWQKHLAGNLIQQLQDTIEVWNCGTAGADPCYSYVLLRDKLFQYKPDLVILTVNDSDVDDITFRGGLERFLENCNVQFNEKPLLENIYQYCYVLRYPIRSICGFDFIPSWDRIEHLKSVNDKLISTVDSIYQLCEKNGAAFLIVFCPRETDITMKREYRFHSLRKYVEGKYNYVDVRDKFKLYGIDSKNVRKYYWEKDFHFNNAGYYQFSQAIYEDVYRLVK